MLLPLLLLLLILLVGSIRASGVQLICVGGRRCSRDSRVVLLAGGLAGATCRRIM
jgi:hypothetical protein